MLCGSKKTHFVQASRASLACEMIVVQYINMLSDRLKFFVKKNLLFDKSLE